MSVTQSAEDVVTGIVGPTFQGFGVVFTPTPLHHRKSKRHGTAALHGAVLRVVATVRETRDLAAGRASALASSLADCLVVTRGRDELIAAIADRFRAGDNAWDHDAAADAIVSAHMWHDKTHPLVT